MAAQFPGNHNKLYFDTLCRTQKGESVLSLIHATYQAKKSNADNIKEDIAKRLKDAYNLFKKEAGTYTGDLKQFSSQYTIGHELCIWKNSELDLTELALKVAENYITIRDYFDIVFLNYIQPVNGEIIHLLYHLLVYMENNHKSVVTKEEMASVYMNVGRSTEKGEINGAYNMLISSSYFKADPSGKELQYSAKVPVSELITRCDTRYIEKGYEAAKNELGTETEYIKYLLHDYRSNTAVSVEGKKKNFVTGGENILLYGVPGVGKSHTIKKYHCNDTSKMERLVFHPDYTYSDFVGQILPRVKEQQVKYEFVPGPFTKILKKAWDNPSEKFYLIIEEINRGNAPAIFGEIFQLLDRISEEDSSENLGESEYGITNYEVAEYVYGSDTHEVKISSNLTILATMNTADQNVFTLDTAFQRRWNMQHIKNDISAAKHASNLIEGSAVTWGDFATIINELVIEVSIDIASSEDKRLGAYFVKANELRKDKFAEKVLKYLWDDAFKLDKEAIFNEEFKSFETVIDAFERAETDKLKAVLRADIYNRMLNDIKVFGNEGA